MGNLILATASAAVVFAGVAIAQPQSTCSSSKTACSSHGEKSGAMAAMLGSTILETAESAGSFKTLVAAVQAAGLDGALAGDGPFTVFAPTDAAFAALPKGTVETLLKPENKKQLASILKYHVVAGEIPATDVVRMTGATTLNGQRMAFETDGKAVMVNGANVSKANIECSNGIIHVIDSVILPTSEDIVATARSAGMFETLLAAAGAAGLVETLQSDGPLTVLAPTDDAFAKLPKGTVENLLKPENKAQLAAILKYHVVPGRVYAMDAVNAGKAATAQGQSVIFSIRDGQLMVDGAKVIATDIDASNGVVHVIDRVILPSN